MKKLADVTSNNSVDSVISLVVNSLVDNVIASLSDSVDVLSNLFSPVPVPVVLSNSMLNPLASLFVSEENSKSGGTHLKDIRIENIGNIIVAHLNINSLRNKFDFLAEMVIGNVDILIIGETKLDSSFPKSLFKIDGFKKPYRIDRNEHGGGVMV